MTETADINDLTWQDFARAGIDTDLVDLTDTAALGDLGEVEQVWVAYSPDRTRRVVLAPSVDPDDPEGTALGWDLNAQDLGPDGESWEDAAQVWVEHSAHVPAEVAYLTGVGPRMVTRVYAWVAVKGGGVDDDGNILVEHRRYREEYPGELELAGIDQTVLEADLIVDEDADPGDPSHRDAVLARAETVLARYGWTLVRPDAGSDWIASAGQYAALVARA